jgi:hypothetical protein
MTKIERSWRVFWAIVALCAGSVHLGTAVLRMNSFIPTVQALDFSSYYAAAWSLRLGMSPYALSPELLDFLEKTQNLSHTPPTCASSPLWVWLMQPMTTLAFPSAAAVWLLLSLIIATFCHILLADTAGYRSWKIVCATLPITLSFGPLFLNLTLGQNALVLLLCALVMAEALQKQRSRHKTLWFPVWILAIAAKIFPILWLGCLPFLKRWRMVLTAFGSCIIVFVGFVLLKPDANQDYWQRYLIGRAEQYSHGGADVDDQSLKAFLDRIGRPGQFLVSGLSVHDRQEVTWKLPWRISNYAIYWATAITAILIGVWLLYLWIRHRNRDPAAVLHSLILFTVIFFPNMQRYNHLLALPAMAWLWQNGACGRKLAIAAYALFALSRLNHLWAIFLPSPLAPIASGFGLFGIFVLLAGVICFLHSTDRRSQ